MKYLDKETNADIIRAVIRRYVIKGSAFVLLSTVILVFFYVYAFDYFAERLSSVSAIAAIVLFLGGLFVLMGLHKDVFDRSWEGEILSIKSQMERSKKENVAANNKTVSVSRHVILEEYITLTVNLGHDLLIYKRPAAELSRFKKGDRVRRVRGTRYLQACRRESTIRDCVMCGAIIRESGNECPHCHMSLVKFDPPASWGERRDKE